MSRRAKAFQELSISVLRVPDAYDDVADGILFLGETESGRGLGMRYLYRIAVYPQPVVHLAFELGDIVVGEQLDLRISAFVQEHLHGLRNWSPDQIVIAITVLDEHDDCATNELALC